MNNTIFIASDHAGYQLKQYILDIIKNHKLVDLGPPDSEVVDYPDYAHLVCESVLEIENSYGILICGTGIGMSIAANRLTKIRAALCLNSFMAMKARQHNNANILVLGAKIIELSEVENIINKFFTTNFEGGRHTKRVNKLS